jgi:hypothetical protein
MLEVHPPLDVRANTSLVLPSVSRIQSEGVSGGRGVAFTLAINIDRGGARRHNHEFLLLAEFCWERDRVEEMIRLSLLRGPHSHPGTR